MPKGARVRRRPLRHGLLDRIDQLTRRIGLAQESDAAGLLRLHARDSASLGSTPKDEPAAGAYAKAGFEVKQVGAAGGKSAVDAVSAANLHSIDVAAPKPGSPRRSAANW